jgi:hypothetical protein
MNGNKYAARGMLLEPRLPPPLCPPQRLSDSALTPHSDPCDVLVDWFREVQELVVLGPGPIAESCAADDRGEPLLVSGRRYAAGDYPVTPLCGVILEHDPSLLPAISQRFQSSESQPLIMHAYLPHQPILSFIEHRLPRPAPILPLLIRSGMYSHRPGGAPPDVNGFALLLAAALNKQIVLRGSASCPRGQACRQKISAA